MPPDATSQKLSETENVHFYLPSLRTLCFSRLTRGEIDVTVISR